MMKKSKTAYWNLRMSRILSERLVLMKEMRGESVGKMPKV
jgi:hypothetical protein